ncbi:hypothetical protein SMICM304S_07617 [Streptomyces microflavus]
MAPIPLQRDTVQRPGTTRAGYAHGPRLASRTSLPGIPLAPSAARRFVRAALAEWTGLGVPAAVGFSDRLADDAVTVTNELVTNAVVHAGTTVDLVLRLEEEGGDAPSAALVLEVNDHHPARPVGADEPGAAGAPGVRTPSRRRRARPASPTPPSTAGVSSSSPPSPSPGASPTAPASRPSGPGSPSTTGAARPPRPTGTPCGGACAPPRSSPPLPGAPNATTRSGTAVAPRPSSPRRPTCSPGSSTRTWWPP